MTRPVGTKRELLSTWLFGVPTNRESSSAGARVAILSVILSCALAGGCGGADNRRGGDPTSSRETSAASSEEPALGPGPWERGAVEAFLRPAYEAMSTDLGGLLLFTCSPGGLPGLNPPDVPDEQVFLCVAAFAGGQSGGRLIVFDRAGRVVDELDPPNRQTVNPGVSCTSRPDISPELPDCDDVRVPVDQPPLPAADPALYGSEASSSSTPSEEDEEAGPAKCGLVNGELVQASDLDCAEGRRVADLVTDAPACAPPVDGDEHACRLEDYTCELKANADPANPWAVTCSTDPRFFDTYSGAPSVSFYVPSQG